jgi:two-component SAPR family response regulator
MWKVKKQGNKKCRIFFLLIILFIIEPKVNSQNLSDQTFLITDLSNTKISEAIIKNELRYRSTGFNIQLEYNKENENISFIPVNKDYSFIQFSGELKTFLKNNTNRIFPLFIDYTGPVRVLNEAFVSSGLSEFVFFLPQGERWPDTERILSENKNLIVFTFQKPSQGNSFFHYAWDNIAEYPHSGIEDPLFDGHYINGDISKELLLIRDLEIPASIDRQNLFLLDINQNQFYINHILNRWKNTGKQPNFIFAGRNSRFLSPLIPWLNTYKSVKGVVKINDKPMEKVFWKHSNKSITNGYFSFPYSEGEELNLTPFSPGFTFNPQSFIVSNENLILSIAFSANPLSLNDGLTAYFPFDNNWNNYLDKNEKIVPTNATFTSDITKGEVAKLPENSYIVIGKPENYGIRNNSFSVSAWFKLNEVNIGGEYSILGTPEGVFRKGLHLVIRQGRPYFGFYGNDLWAEKIIEPNEWFHIVFRYNYFNGEQAIYVNGLNVGASFNHASFIGDSALVVGKSINKRNFLNGYIDDLYIWNRPIGEEEIQFLYNSEYKPVIDEKRNLPSGYWIIPVLSLLAGFIFFVIYKNRRKQGHTKQSTVVLKKADEQNKNSLFLFGDFQIFDLKGEELSARFTPKLKELFLLILLYGFKHKKGIKTEKLTSILWADFQSKKAANNRSVTFNKLRKIIENVNGLSIEYNNGYWKIKAEKDFYCDYFGALSILENRDNPTRQDLELFFNFVRKGVFLNEIYWEWLDEFRGFVSNEIIDNLLQYASFLNEKDDCQLLKAIAERILLNDDMNEKALQIVIRQLINSNNLNKARFRYSQFLSSYNEAYGEPYTLSFEDFKEKDF